jgi:hypothetical protein
MLPKDEIKRRVCRLLQAKVEDRPAGVGMLHKLSGIAHHGLYEVAQGHDMRPERQRRLSRVLEFLENDQLPDPKTLPGGPTKYKKIALKPKANPPCKPVMVLDLTSGVPRMRTEFVNPNTMPEIVYTKVRK